MIKYLGSKRTLIPVLSQLAQASGAQTALDLFTGTTRVAQAFKKLGMTVTASDVASYAECFGKTWIELDSDTANLTELAEAIGELESLPGEAGYFTQKFCVEARYFQPKNGERVDAIRERIEADYRDSWLYYPLLTSLILGADRVDSTTGIQMAFLKGWASRSGNRLELRDPDLLPGAGQSIRGDALEIVKELPPVDLAYLDPPYNQHRYFSNYHVWESLVRWDKPETYGIANKRIDARDAEMKSPFNSKKTMAGALARLVDGLNCETMVLSYNNESWLSRNDLLEIASKRGHVEILDFDFKRYVGSQIGVFNKAGERVGNPGAKRNIEHIVIAGEKQTVKRMLASIK
ncbi:MAG: DNA adenine methylase [Rhodoluna sp.]|nr:DNA adenine methylase [Rhodoluna sp.]